VDSLSEDKRSKGPERKANTRHRTPYNTCVRNSPALNAHRVNWCNNLCTVSHRIYSEKVALKKIKNNYYYTKHNTHFFGSNTSPLTETGSLWNVTHDLPANQLSHTSAQSAAQQHTDYLARFSTPVGCFQWGPSLSLFAASQATPGPGPAPILLGLSRITPTRYHHARATLTTRASI
jgi:hypothetical protein